MGYRTVVVLFNDQAGEWSKDPDLGQKIMVGMNDAMSLRKPPDWTSRAEMGYGRVAQCAHADTESLVLISGYSMHPIIHSFYNPNRQLDEQKLELVREAARGMGYRLVKVKGKDES